MNNPGCQNETIWQSWSAKSEMNTISYAVNLQIKKIDQRGFTCGSASRRGLKLINL